jgi:hypothetical protein
MPRSLGRNHQTKGFTAWYTASRQACAKSLFLNAQRGDYSNPSPGSPASLSCRCPDPWPQDRSAKAPPTEAPLLVTMRRAAGRSGRSQREGRGTQRVGRSTPGMEPVNSRTWPGGQLPSSTRTMRPVGKLPDGGAWLSTSGSAQAETRPHETRSAIWSVFMTENVPSNGQMCKIDYACDIPPTWDAGQRQGPQDPARPSLSASRTGDDVRRGLPGRGRGVGFTTGIKLTRSDQELAPNRI